MLLVFFGDRILFVWTGDTHIVKQVAPLLSVLAAGTLLSGLILMPYHVQNASGWTSLRVWIDSIAVLIFVPAILLIVPHYGSIGAVWIMFTLNAARMLVNVPLMHRRLLKTERNYWFFQDVMFPLAGALLGAIILRWLMPANMGRLGEAGILIAVVLVMLLISSMSSTLVRNDAEAIS